HLPVPSRPWLGRQMPDPGGPQSAMPVKRRWIAAVHHRDVQPVTQQAEVAGQLARILRGCPLQG
ncbi:MAG TPA: hypothetical protein VNT27_16435, partial [Propionibacteriaceae bacterium]|nr:hypothetical protein [Propionibacteriaceae bacterium]